MKYKNIKLKIAAILIVALSGGIGMNAYALQKIELIPAKYDTGAPAKTLGNNIGVSMTANKQVGYEVNFSDSPAMMKLRLGSYKNTQSTLEIWVDGVNTGTKIGTVITNPTVEWTNSDYEINIDAQIKGKHTIYIKSNKGTCDLQGISFLINEAGDVYPEFSVENEFSNVDDKIKSHKLNVLGELGIIDNNVDYNGDEFITRREYIRILNKLYDESNAGDKQIFADVPAVDADFGAISNLYARKIIKGTTGGMLQPDKFITSEEMLRMSLRAMGYFYAEEIGESAFITAANADILTSVGLSGETVRRDAMVNLLYNMLTGNVVEQSGGGHTTEYTKVKNGVLSITKDVYFATDVVSDNGFTNIYDVDSKVAKGEVQIGDKVFSTKNTKAANYVGMKCLYFYKEDKNENYELLAVVPDKKLDYITFLSTETEFVDIKERFISYYDEKDKERDIDLSPSTSFVFNGKAIDKELRELVPDVSEFNGRIIAIDNDGDEVYDVVLIDSFKSMIFGGVSDNEIYDKLSETRQPIYNKDDALVYIGGTRIEWSDIPENSVIDVYQSQNATGEKTERIIVNTDVINGTVTKKDDDEIFVDDTAYEFYYGMTELPGVGVYMNLYLNSYGQIVRYVKSADSIKLGYLFDLIATPDDVGEDTYIAKILTEENTVTKVSFAENTIIDGVRIKGNEELINGKTPFGGAATLPIDAPILYKVNSDGLLTYLDTTRTSADNDQDNLTPLLAEGTYKNKTVGFTTGSDTNLMCVFATDKKVITTWSTGEEELANIGGVLTSGNQTNITASAYTTNKNSILSDVVIWKNRKVGNHQSDFVFKSVSQKVNDDNDIVTVLQGITGNTEVEYPVNGYVLQSEAENGITYERLIASLKPGDLLSVGTNARGEAEVVTVILFANGEGTNNIGVTSILSKTIPTDNWYSRGVTSHGKILAIEEGTIKFEKDNNGIKEIEYMPCSSAKIIKIENGNGKVNIINNLSVNQLMVGDHIVLAKNPEAYSATTVFLYDTIEW